MSKTFISAIIASAFLLTTPAVSAPDMSNVVGSVYDNGSIVKTEKTRKTNTASVKKKSGVKSHKTSNTKTIVLRGKFNAGPKPGRWCGWYARTIFGGGPEYNLARNWAKRGKATSARIGAVVVWPNHVGYISGRAANGQWIITSGNDSNRVRSRPRSLKNVIAIRAL